MRILRALVLGLVATGILAYTIATAAAIIVASSGATIDVRFGPLVVLAVEELDDGGAVTTMGPGLLLVALVGGAVNAGGALVIARRAGRAP